MPRLRQHIGLPFESPIATPEQRARALQVAEEEMTKLRDMVRRLDLPVTALEQVTDIYVCQLNAITSHDHFIQQSRIDLKIKKLTGLMIDKDPAEARRARRHLGLPELGNFVGGGVDVVNSDLFEMSEAELDAEIAKLSSEK